MWLETITIERDQQRQAYLVFQSKPIFEMPFEMHYTLERLLKDSTGGLETTP